MVPAISAKIWFICNVCGNKSDPLEDDQIMFDVCPVGWAFLRERDSIQESEMLHLCPDCFPALTAKGVKLFPKAVDILGEDYFQ